MHFDKKRKKLLILLINSILFFYKTFIINTLKANYERILEVLRKISKENLLPYQRRVPKMSDLEVLSLTAEYMGIDSENHLFRNLSDFFTDKIERSVYNRRRRKLAIYTD